MSTTAAPHRHAALITAYKDFPMLDVLTETLLADGHRVFVHLDRRRAGKVDEIERLRAKGCKVLLTYKIHWGSYNHLLAIVDLMGEALSYPDIAYVHTLSGQDYPVASAERLCADCDGAIFMSCRPLSEAEPWVKARFERYNILQRLEGAGRLYRRLNKLSLAIQRLTGVKRRSAASYRDVSKGLIWMSLPADVARYALSNPAANQLLRSLKHAYVPEELFFQTVIANSPFAQRIASSHRRYMRWEAAGKGGPAFLTHADGDAAIASNAFFARKLQSKTAGGLIEKLGSQRAVTSLA